MGVEARSHGSTAQSEFKQVIQRKVQATEVGVELRHPSRGFLPEGQGNGVHQVRATDLDDVVPINGFGVKRVAQGANAGKQAMREGFSCSDVHGGWKGVVGRLRSIHVVVWMNGCFRTKHSTGEFDGTVGDDLVGVHVGLRSASRLPYTKREVVVKMAVDHVLGGGDDEVAHLGVKLLEGHVGLGSGLFEDTKSSNHAQRHGVVANVKIQQRPSGLTAVVAVGGDFEFAHGVGFNSHLTCRSIRTTWGACWSRSRGLNSNIEALLDHFCNRRGTSTFSSFADTPVQFLC